MNINQRLTQIKAFLEISAIFKEKKLTMKLDKFSDLFIERHLGLNSKDEKIMLEEIGFSNIQDFIKI